MGVKNPIMKILSLVYCLPLFLVIFCTSTVTGLMATPTNTHSNGKTVPLSKAVGGKPSDDVLMLNKKGVALLILGKFNESIVYFDKALAINPKSLENLDNKGDALLNLGKYKEAIAYFDKVLALDPNYFLSLYNKGAALNKLGKYSESIAYFDKALALKPTSRHALAGKKMVLAEIRSELSSIPQDPSMFGYYFGSNIPGQPPKNATSAK